MRLCLFNREVCHLTPPQPSPTGGGGKSAGKRVLAHYRSCEREQPGGRFANRCHDRASSVPSPHVNHAPFTYTQALNLYVNDPTP